jgi:LytR cell envelope-related transcriptional attenuator
VEHVQPRPAPFPWRAATVVVGGVALVELIALIAIGLAQLAPSHAPKHRAALRVAPKPVVRHTHVQTTTPAVPLRPRSRVHVLVLNGNGVSGAASVQAARLQGDGYRIAGATNAARHDYASSMVMYVPGWSREARRLARETGVRIVSPVDGRTPLKGSKVILLLGK